MADVVDKTEPGHMHDIESTDIAGVRCTAYALDHKTKSEKHLDEPPMTGVRYGSGYLRLGVSGEEITLSVNCKGTGWADPEPKIDGVISIENAEHTINVLITLVKQAKKNRIDMPKLFGSGYRGVDLVDNDDDKEQS